MTTEKDNKPYVRENNYGLLVVFSLIVLSTLIGFFVFYKYNNSQSEITRALTHTQQIAPSLSIEQCADKNMQWFQSCNSMAQVCTDTVSRMIKICLVNGQKEKDCKQFGDEIYGYNFGAKQCAPFLSKKDLKRACADTWQSIADFCKAERKANKS